MAFDRDYYCIAVDYANKCLADKKGKSHGKYIKQAAERFLRDLKRAKKKDCDFIFSESHACDPCDFIEKLPHVEGKWDTDTIVLHPAQVFFVVQLFGFRKKSDGTRRFTSALYATARKSGKSTLAAGIMLYCQCCEKENGAQLMSAATTFGQASIIFNTAKRMAEKEHELRQHFGIDVWAKSISRPQAGSAFFPIHAKASTQDGLNPSHVALDEIHAHKTADLLNVLTSAAGARRSPLWLYTTTEGYTSPGPWADIRLFAKQLLAGIFGDTADHFLAIFYAIDKDDDDFDESCWIKANPLIDVNPHLLTAIRKEAVEAKQMPSKLAEFKIKRLNRPASSSDGWIDLGKWASCDKEVDLDWLSQYPCWGGLDLASTRDLTAFRLVWNIDDVIYAAGWRWVPDEAVAYRTERGTVPYASWVASGFIKQTPGNVTDYNIVKADILELDKRFDIKSIAYDRYNAGGLINDFIEYGLDMIEFVQGTASYHGPMQDLERAYISGKLCHGADPVLNWCASNTVVRLDAGMRMAPDKKKSADKIDDIAALLMAIGISGKCEDDSLDFLGDLIK